MSKPVAQMLFNKVLTNFLDDFVEAWGDECPGAKAYVDWFKQQVVDNTEAPDMVMQRFIEDLKAVPERRRCLIEEDSKLFTDKTLYQASSSLSSASSSSSSSSNISEFQLLVHLGLPKLWRAHQKDKSGHKTKDLLMDKNDRKYFWIGLRKLCLIADSMLLLPEKVVKELERVAQLNSAQAAAPFSDDAQRKQNLDVYHSQANEMLKDLKMKHFQRLLHWCKQMILAQYSPVWELVPANYRHFGENIRRLIQDPSNQQLLLKCAAPVFKQVQNTAKQNGIMDVNSMDSLMESPDEISDFLNTADEIDSAEDESSVPTSQQDMKLIGFVIDLLFKIIQNNQKSISEVFSDPMVLVNLMMNPSKISDLSQDIREQIENLQMTPSSSSSSSSSSLSPNTSETKTKTSSNALKK